MSKIRTTLIAAAAATSLFGTALFAQASPFGEGWELESEASKLQFQSIKNGSKIETSSFAKLTGTIDANGNASLKVLLDSVDTKVDLRNVRMRFLFFETFEFPEASITTQIDPALIADLADVRRKTLTLPFTMNLHGVTKEMTADLSLTLIGEDLVAVSTAEPINVAVADFNLAGGLQKLEEAANVEIVPSSTVSFDFIFRKTGDTQAPVATAAVTEPVVEEPVEEPVAAPQTAALETEGEFSLEACIGRFEILSRTDNIYFSPGSARLEAKSSALLDTVADIVKRCPQMNIEIAGHTDSVGAATYNQRLSEQRAASVVSYLTGQGIVDGRMTAVGFGEARPIADNGTKEGRWRNRRIEFSVPQSGS